MECTLETENWKIPRKFGFIIFEIAQKDVYVCVSTAVTVRN